MKTSKFFSKILNQTGVSSLPEVVVSGALVFIALWGFMQVLGFDKNQIKRIENRWHAQQITASIAAVLVSMPKDEYNVLNLKPDIEYKNDKLEFLKIWEEMLPNLSSNVSVKYFNTSNNTEESSPTDPLTQYNRQIKVTTEYEITPGNSQTTSVEKWIGAK